MNTTPTRIASLLWLPVASDVALAQGGPMMGGGVNTPGWMGNWMGGYGGYWIPVLLIVIVALLVWIVMQRRK